MQLSRNTWCSPAVCRSNGKTDTAAALRKYENDPAAVDPEKPIGGCIAMREDYFECLHGRKENLRIKTVMAELKKQEHESKHGVAAGAH
jgi:hypothetical protein